MTDREKLIDILRIKNRCPDTVNSCMDCPYHVMAMPGHCDEESLQADRLLANGVTFQKWIPVTERLPEKPGYVLAYWKYIQEDEMYIDRLNYDGECFPWENFGFNGKHKVTHWMPLPEPPKEE